MFSSCCTARLLMVAIATQSVSQSVGQLGRQSVIFHPFIYNLIIIYFNISFAFFSANIRDNVSLNIYKLCLLQCKQIREDLAVQKSSVTY